jgi:hypothetical protein
MNRWKRILCSSDLLTLRGLRGSFRPLASESINWPQVAPVPNPLPAARRPGRRMPRKAKPGPRPFHRCSDLAIRSGRSPDRPAGGRCRYGTCHCGTNSASSSRRAPAPSAGLHQAARQSSQVWPDRQGKIEKNAYTVGQCSVATRCAALKSPGTFCATIRNRTRQLCGYPLVVHSGSTTPIAHPFL